jgi:type II secretory pathway component PulJ
MKRILRSGRRGFWLLEAVLAVAIFSLGVLGLGSAVNNCLIAQRIKQEDLRARLALHNRMAEIEAGSIPLNDAPAEELKGAFEGMKIRQSRVPLVRKNEKEQDITGIFVVTLEILWESQGEKLSRELTFYVYPRQ